MEQEKQMIRIAIGDDHGLIRTALTTLINTFGNCSILFEAGNGKELLRYLNAGMLPDIILLDLNMPEMDGFQTAAWLLKNHPQIHVIMVSMYETETTIIRLLQSGVKGFVRKQADPSDLRNAINTVMQMGYCYTNSTTGKLINLFRTSREHSAMMKSSLTETELRFLKLACSDLTYKEIANQMNMNPRSIDNLRDTLFDRLEVKSRVGLAMYAVKHCIYTD